MAPGDGVAEGPLALGNGAGPRGEDREALLEPGKQLLGSEELGSRGRQLDGQGKAVQSSHDPGHGRSVLLRDPESRPNRMGSLREQPDRLGSAERGKVPKPPGIGKGERRHHVLLLSADGQHDAGGDQDVQLRGGQKEVLEHRHRLGHLLEIVEDQQDLLVAEVILQGLHQGGPERPPEPPATGPEPRGPGPGR